MSEPSAEIRPLRDQPWGEGIPQAVRTTNDLIIDAATGRDWALARSLLLGLWESGYTDGQLDRAEPEPPECKD